MHWYLFLSLSQFDWELSTTRKCLLTSDDLVRGQCQNIEPWCWRIGSVIMILTKSDWSDEYPGNEKHFNFLNWLVMGSSQEWHGLRLQTSKIWDIFAVDWGGLITIYEFQVTPSFTVTWAGWQLAKSFPKCLWRWGHLLWHGGDFRWPAVDIFTHCLESMVKYRAPFLRWDHSRYSLKTARDYGRYFSKRFHVPKSTLQLKVQ